MGIVKLSIRLGCVAALGIAIGAYASSSQDARQSSQGSGSASFRIWGGASDPLFPGAPAVPVELGFTNPNTFAITVSDVTVNVGGTTSAGCDSSNFVTGQQLDVAVKIPAGATRSLSQLGVPSSAWPHLAMVASPRNQDACKHASIQLAYAGEASGAEPPDTPVGVASGTVYVNGELFNHGGIRYGAEVLIKPGGKLTLHTTSGKITVYPPPGQSISFIVHRVFVASPYPLNGAATSSAAKPQLYTELRLTGGLAGCTAKGRPAVTTPAQGGKPKPARSLWAEGGGRLRIRGHFAVATAHGARWLTKDRCHRTLVKVVKNTVRVDGITRPGTAFIAADHSYAVRDQARIGPKRARGGR